MGVVTHERAAPIHVRSGGGVRGESFKCGEIRRPAPCGRRLIAVSQVREVQGELVELGARRSGEKAPDIAEKGAFFGELLWIVRDRGYSSGWAAHKYREKFGVWPNDPRIRCATASRPSLKTKNWIVSRQIAFIKGRRTYG